jgi:2-desacetyl-2-hydroxyethyl bacteriochlorophyllide A dehydrogenase
LRIADWGLRIADWGLRIEDSEAHVKIQRLVFTEQGRCEVEDAELDEQLGPGEVLVRNRCLLISAGAELAMFTRTHRGFDVPDFAHARYPFYPGHAALGEIVAGNDEWKPGQRVFHAGRHATHAKLSALALTPAPEGLPDEQAVFFRPAQVALTAPRLAPVRLGEQVLVIGVGVLGNVCAQLYALSGAALVAAADVSAARLERARACGLEKLFCTGTKPLGEWLKELGKRGPEIVVEASGSSSGILDALEAAVNRGLVVLLGEPRARIEVDPYFQIFRKGIALIGAPETSVGAPTRKQDQAFLMELLRSGRLRVAPLLTHRLPFAQAHEAYAGLRDKPDEYLGVVLTLGS